MPTVLWRGWTTFTVPELPLLIVSDATPEALGLRLAEQDERLSVFDAEGGGLITMMGGQYGNRPNLDLLLKAHDGHPTTVVRVKNEEPHALMSPQLTIGVLSQREVLRQVMGVEGGVLVQVDPRTPARPRDPGDHPAQGRPAGRPQTTRRQGPAPRRRPRGLPATQRR
jgi:Protein of unknown function (DUF3987)